MADKYFGDKQPSEEYNVSFNFSRVIQSGSNIESASVVAVDAQGTDVTDELIGSVTLSGKYKVVAFVQGGTVQRYKITCYITCDDGEKYEDEAYLNVVEK